MPEVTAQVERPEGRSERRAADARAGWAAAAWRRRRRGRVAEGRLVAIRRDARHRARSPGLSVERGAIATAGRRTVGSLGSSHGASSGCIGERVTVETSYALGHVIARSSGDEGVRSGVQCRPQSKRGESSAGDRAVQGQSSAGDRCLVQPWPRRPVSDDVRPRQPATSDTPPGGRRCRAPDAQGRSPCRSPWS